VLDSATAINNHFFVEPYLMIGPGGTVIRRKYFNEIGGFPEKYGPSNDMYYNLKASCRSSVLMIPFEFFYYRSHPGQEIHNQFSYLYNNYRYNRDSFNELDLPVTKAQLLMLHKKNKRRFVVNIFNFFLQTRDIKKTKFAIQQAEFSFKDAWQGIFHL
jgi:GT2 family glycosyltransferase